MTQSKSVENKTAGGDQPFFIGQKLEVHIDSLSFGGGRGVARHSGFVLFIPETAPNETALIQITKVKKKFAEARLLKVLAPSPNRRPAPCPVAHECGGCCWQHVSYDCQIEQKHNIVKKALSRLAQKNDFPINPVIPSANEFRYRNRIQIHKSGHLLGFFKTKSRDLVPVEDCLIADENLTKTFDELKNRPDKQARFEIAIEQSGQVSIFTEKRPGHLALFSQVNQSQNLNLIDISLKMIKSQGFTPELIYDFYCGAGNFTFPLKNEFTSTKIIGVELSKSSIDRAQQESKGEIQFIAADVGQYLESIPSMPSNSLVFLDPPRTGCDPGVIENLSRILPEMILYVSCNPTTLARDLESLSDDYRIREVTPVDMFPQTDHIEAIACLVKNEKS